MEQKRNNPLIYRYYDFLKENHMGKENGISRDELAKFFKVDLHIQKMILRTINNSNELPRLISTSGAIYMCNTEKECQTAYFNEIKSGLSRLLKGKQMAKKCQLNNQYKIQLGKYYKDIIEVFGDEYGGI